MRKLFYKFSDIVLRNFKILWAVISTTLILVTLFINWNASIDRTYQELLAKASKMSNNVDGFIEDLFQDIYTLPIYGTNFSNCKTTLLLQLQHITLNNPNIAGITISNEKNELICSTLTNNDNLNFKIQRPRTLIGPFSHPSFDQYVYLIQQKMGAYRVGLVFIPAVIKNILKINDKSIDAIALYDKYDKKNILFLNRNGTNWTIDNNTKPQAEYDLKLINTRDQLQSITGVYLVVYQNKSTLYYNIFISELFVGILLLCSLVLIFNVLNNIVSKHLSLHGSIRTAIKNKEFYPVYQPMYCTESKGFTAVEVLVRWRKKTNEIVMPDLFIAEAETSGLIVPITLQIIEIAFKEAQQLLKNYPDFHLGFNLSSVHFIDPNFFKQFYQLVKTYHILPKHILFEITERDLLDKENIQFALIMKQLRSQGYSIAVDDYGTGNASISYLQSFPFNFLKIDKLFIQAIGTKAITESLNDAIIQMAKDLQLTIIAEGVETEDQVNYLTENGVRYLQGWYFSKAVNMEQLLALLKGDQK